MSGFTSVWFIDKAIGVAQQLLSAPAPKTKRVLIAVVCGFVLMALAVGLGYGPFARNEPETAPQPATVTTTSSTGPAIANGNGNIANSGTIGTVNANPKPESADKKK